METWQRKHITKNLPRLIQMTEYNCAIKTVLMAEQILDVSDVDILDATIYKGKLEQSSKLYDILQGRKQAYEVLTKALLQFNQSGALKILIEGFTNQRISKPLTVCGISIEANNFEDVGILVLGKMLKIKEIFSSVKMDKLQGIFQSALQELDYYEMFVNKEKVLTLVNNTIPPPPPFYIRRLLSNTVKIDPAIFKEDCSDIFVFKNIERQHLSNLAKPCSTSSSSMQVESLSSRFICLDYDGDWINLLRLSNKPVHLISYNHKDKSFFLENSSSYSEFLRSFLMYHDRTFMSEEEFIIQQMDISKKQSLVCICDTPGMGKTVLLSNIARSVATYCSRNITAFITISRFLETISDPFEKKLDNIPTTDILVHVTKYISPSSENANLLLILVNENLINFQLFFDGFDEINSSEFEWMSKALKELISTIPNITVYVTSRPHIGHELENVHNVNSFNILPFKLENQVDFLVKTWSYSSLNCNIAKLTAYASQILDALDKTFSLNGGGIPLQCQLIGEVYSKEAKMYATSETTTEQLWCRPRTICEMYGKFIEKRINVVLGKINRDKLKTLTDAEVIVRDTMKNIHMSKALLLIFPNNPLPFPEVSNSIEKIFETFIYHAGIIQMDPSSRKNEFVHRTFAEYLCAEFFARFLNFEDYKPEFSDKCFETFFSILSECLIIEQNRNLFEQLIFVRFLNSLIRPNITGHFSYRHVIIFCEVVSPAALKAILFCCCEQNFLNIFNIFKEVLLACNETQLANYVYLFTKDEYFAIINTVATNANCDFIQSYFELLEIFRFDIADLSNSLLQKVLLNADYDIVEYLSEKLGVNNCQLLYKCVSFSHKICNESLQHRKNVLKMLLAKNSNLIQEAHNILVYSDVHLELIKILYEFGANTTKTRFDSCAMKNINFVEHASTYMSPEDMCEFIHYISIDCKAHHPFTKTSKWDIPLSTIAQNAGFLPETLQILQTIPGIDIHMLDMHGENLLFAAVRGNRIGTVRILLSYGLDYRLKRKDKKGLLHICSEYGDTEMMAFLLSLGSVEAAGLKLQEKSEPTLVPYANNLVYPDAQAERNSQNINSAQKFAQKVSNMIFNQSNSKRLNVNDRTENLCSPLHFSKNKSMLEFLVRNGCDISIKNVNGDTAMHCIFDKINPEEFCKTLEFCLISCRLKCFQIKNKQGDTVLHKMLQHKSDVQSKLLELVFKNSKIDINMMNQKGESCMLIASRWCTIDLIKLFLKFGADVRVKNVNGQGLLHYAALNSNTDVIGFLISLKLSVNEIDNKGNTPLHFCRSWITFKSLITSGANILIQNNTGDTVIHSLINWVINEDFFYGLHNSQQNETDENCVEEQRIKIFKYLLEENVGGTLLNNKNKNGQSLLLDWSRGKINLDIKTVLALPEININIRDNNGNTPILLAATHRNVSDIKTLVAFDADFDVCNNEEQNMFHVSANTLQKELIGYCIELGVNSTKRDIHGKTPVDYLFNPTYSGWRKQRSHQ